MRKSQNAYWPLGLTLGISVIVFLRAIGFPASDLDDPRHVFENAHLLNPSGASLGAFWKGEYFSLYVPVTYSAWWLLSQLSLALTGRLSPALFHAANVILHFANIYWLWRLIGSLGKQLDRRASPVMVWVALMIFAIHPWQAESVAWISSFRDVLAMSFSLLSLQYGLRKSYGYAGLLFLLALLSKPGSVFLVGWLAFAVWQITQDRSVAAKRFIAAIVILAGCLIVGTKMLQPDSAVADRVEWWLRPLPALDAVGFFVKRLVWAGGYSLDYGRKPTFIVSQLPTVEFVVALTALLVVLVHKDWRKRGLLVALIFLPLVPYLGILAFQFQKFSTVADRYAYGLLGALALSVGGWAPAWLDNVRWRPFVWGVLALWIGQTMSRVDLWASNEKLFRQTVQTNPRSLLGHTNLAYRLTQEGNDREAIEHLRMSLKLEPQELYFRVALASLYFRGGDANRAESEIEACLHEDPQFAPALAVQRKLADYRTQTRLRP